MIITIITYIAYGILASLAFYLLSKIQMKAWLNIIEKFLNEKSKTEKNEKKKK